YRLAGIDAGAGHRLRSRRSTAASLSGLARPDRRIRPSPVPVVRGVRAAVAERYGLGPGARATGARRTAQRGAGGCSERPADRCAAVLAPLAQWRRVAGGADRISESFGRALVDSGRRLRSNLRFRRIRWFQQSNVELHDE